MTRTILAAALCAASLASPAAAQLPGRHLSLEPFVGYGFFGRLPETSSKLREDPSLGGRAALRLTSRWGLFGVFQRSTPQLIGQLPFGTTPPGGETTVDHWSAGLTFSPSGGGGDGMLPLVLEAGAGQVRYEDGPADLAASLGVSGAAQLSPYLALRYGVSDYVSSFNGGQGLLNQVFVRLGLELSV